MTNVKEKLQKNGLMGGKSNVCLLILHVQKYKFVFPLHRYAQFQWIPRVAFGLDESAWRLHQQPFSKWLCIQKPRNWTTTCESIKTILSARENKLRFWWQIFLEASNAYSYILSSQSERGAKTRESGQHFPWSIISGVILSKNGEVKR